MTDVDRAITYHSAVLQTDLKVNDHADGRTVVILRAGGGRAHHDAPESQGFTPTTDGTVASLGMDEPIEAVAERIKAASGTVSFGPHGTHDDGSILNMIDSEGNTMGTATRS